MGTVKFLQVNLNQVRTGVEKQRARWTHKSSPVVILPKSLGPLGGQGWGEEKEKGQQRAESRSSRFQ